MKPFALKIVTPDGIEFDGMAESVLVRTIDGDVEILAGHTDFISSVSVGRTRVISEGKTLLASSSGGFISVTREGVILSLMTFEFSENIDLDRARRAKERAEQRIKDAESERSVEIAKAKLARAISRINVAEGTKR